MLVRANLVEPQRLPFRNLGKRAAFALIILLVVLAVRDGRGHLIDAEVAVEFLDRAGSAESVISRVDVDGRLIEDCRKHLRRDKTLPDQLVQLEEIFIEIFPHVFRRAHGIGGTHRFVGFLGILLRFVIVGLFRKVIAAESLRNQFTNLRQRVVRDVHGIRAHVGNQRNRAFVTKFHAFVEFLRQRHRALGRVPQPVVSRLLQFGGREGRRRIALLFFLRDAGYQPLRFTYCGHNLFRGFLILYFNVLAVVFE